MGIRLGWALTTAAQPFYLYVMNRTDISERLASLSEPAYARFAASLLPGVDNIMGVRLPALRRLAREIVRGDWRGWLDGPSGGSFEETMLRGMVIGCAPCDDAERYARVAGFVPLIDNWSVCDSFCAGLKFVRRDAESAWRFIEPYIVSPREFEVRFAVVMILSHFVCEERLGAIFATAGRVVHEGYYARMAVAWLLSVCWREFPEAAERYLATAALDEFTLTRTVRKITELRSCSPAAKASLRALVCSRRQAGCNI